MGSCFSNTASSPEPAPKVYSWEKRRQEQSADASKYIVADKDGETIVRMPGEIDGQQFVVRNCKNCSIYVFDHSATVSIDDCSQCKIFLGPVRGSVFIRDCSHIQCAMACQQFRTRDCRKVVCLINCATQPIIEASSGMKFGCLQLYYKQLEEQFSKAKLSLYNNNWSSIHDYTISAERTDHWTVMEQTAFEDLLPFPDVEGVDSLELSSSVEQSVVPLTAGNHAKESNEVCLVVFFESQKHRKNICDFLRNVNVKSQLVQTKEVTMTSDDCKRVFSDRGNEYHKTAEQGPVVGVELSGDDCISVCREILTTQSGGVVYSSASQDHAVQDIDSFYNFVSMAMSA